MKIELLVSNKAVGQIWDISSSTQSASWTTDRTGSPGKFEFTWIKSGDAWFNEGDIIRFSVDGQLQFFGWIFTKSKDRWDVIEVTCYDRLRYLKAKASYAFYNQTSGQIIQQIAADLQIAISVISDTGYALPSLIEDEQTCIDIIGEANQQTLLNTGKIFVFYDDGNGLALKEPSEMISDIVIGDKSLLTDYTYKTDIDEQTYNEVKLARPNEETGKADIFVAQDTANIAQWGLLRLYQKVDGALNDAQMKEQAEESLKYYNRRMRTLKVSSLGVLGLRAGQMILMKVQNLGDISLNQYVLLERVSHTWENSTHTMELETMSI